MKKTFTIFAILSVVFTFSNALASPLPRERTEPSGYDSQYDYPVPPSPYPGQNDYPVPSSSEGNQGQTGDSVSSEENNVSSDLSEGNLHKKAYNPSEIADKVTDESDNTISYTFQ